MYDNEYDLDMILTEARRLKSQKQDDVRKQQAQPPQGENTSVGFSALRDRAQAPRSSDGGSEAPQPFRQSVNQGESRQAEDMPTPQFGQYDRPSGEGSSAAGTARPERPVSPIAPPEPARGFRISRESAVFGEYHAPSAPQERADTFGSGQEDAVRSGDSDALPRRPSAWREESRRREDIINEEYAALRERYRVADEAVQDRRAGGDDRNRPDGRYSQASAYETRDDVTTPAADAAPKQRYPYEEQERYAPMQPEHNPPAFEHQITQAEDEPPPLPQETVRSGFVLRRTQRLADAVPVPPEADPGAVAAVADATRQFDTAPLADAEFAGEMAGGLAVEHPTDAHTRWQAYRMMGQEEHDAAYQDEQPLREDDLNSADDLERVHGVLRKHVIFAIARLGVLTLTCAASIYLVLSTIATVLPVPALFHWQESPRMFAFALFALSLISFGVCITSLGSGLISLFRLKADGDSMAAIAMLSTMLYTLAFIINPALFANPNAQMYCAVAVVGLWFQSVGRLMSAVRVNRNLSVIGSGEPLHTIRILEGEGLPEEMAPLLADGHPRIAALQSADFLQGLLRHSGSGAQDKGGSRILSPICVGAAVVLAASSYFLYRDILTCFTVFTAVICVCSPFTALFGENLPLLRASQSLVPQNTMIAGGEGAELLSDASAAVVEAGELFGSGGITLHGIRTFKGGRIDVSILAAASIMEKVGGTMSDVFFQIIEGRTEILEDVEDIVYEEGMGISAWVNEQHVLIGNRELMRHHGIEIPPREYEHKYQQDGRHILYLAAGGELSSMFVISYHAAEEIYTKLKRLERAHMTLLVRTTDPNITREMITDLFDLDYELVQIMPAQLHGVYARQTAHTDTAPAQAATMGGSLSLLDTLAAAVKIRTAGAAASVIQTVFIIMGYALTTILTFFLGISLINPLLLLCYQLVTTLITMAFLSLRRY